LSKTYQIVTRAAKESAAVIEQFCKANGQILLPIVNLIQSASEVVDCVIHEIGVKTLEMILALSAEPVAGPRTPGKARGEIRHHGSQQGRIQLADRKVRVRRPRRRHKTTGEVKVPAYEALFKNQALSQYMLGALLGGISTREYHEVLPKTAETVGVSRSAVSRQAMEASIEQLQQLQERRWHQVEILVIYIDGQRFIEQRQLEYDYSSAARSLREGLKEMFTLQRLKIPTNLHKCLATANLIESPHSGVRKRTRNVCRWRDVDMVERWAASAWLLAEKNFRRIDGHKELWALAAILGREISSSKEPKVA
jgi:transposase-like protein